MPKSLKNKQKAAATGKASTPKKVAPVAADKKRCMQQPQARQHLAPRGGW